MSIFSGLLLGSGLGPGLPVSSLRLGKTKCQVLICALEIFCIDESR